MQNTAALLFKGWIVPAHLPVPVPSTCFSPEGLSWRGHGLGSPFSCAEWVLLRETASLQGCRQLVPESEGASALPYEGRIWVALLQPWLLLRGDTAGLSVPGR